MAIGYRQLLRLISMDAVAPFLMNTKHYLLNLKTASETPLHSTHRCWVGAFTFKCLFYKKLCFIFDIFNSICSNLFFKLTMGLQPFQLLAMITCCKHLCFTGMVHC